MTKGGTRMLYISTHSYMQWMLQPPFASNVRPFTAAPPTFATTRVTNTGHGTCPRCVFERGTTQLAALPVIGKHTEFCDGMWNAFQQNPVT